MLQLLIPEIYGYQKFVDIRILRKGHSLLGRSPSRPTTTDKCRATVQLNMIFCELAAYTAVGLESVRLLTGPQLILPPSSQSVTLVSSIWVSNTGEAGEKPLGNHDERVVSCLFHNLALSHGCTEAEALHGDKAECLHIFRESPLPQSCFIKNGKSFLESILFFTR